MSLRDFDLIFTGSETSPEVLKDVRCRILRNRNGSPLFYTTLSILVCTGGAFTFLAAKKFLVKATSEKPIDAQYELFKEV